ncbi:DUF6504 family protein [Alicyclobacillus mengziensis]|uniref:DUF6504 domain-containing protein n=1 Tax=Alicyclobacillus mengziensis TaxID=2931921 RepID=A0A9X7W472_9BACL|nr:DUF6504 family protein [Alicyclobacillus mengziensis]QSO50099.1 hypothetical protein JZ786_24600 [Alicyclobacillus mengziensis]
MSRIVNRPIKMCQLSEDGAPKSFTDRDITHVVVAVIDHWRESGNWIAGESHHTIYRVITNTKALLDLEEHRGNWAIYRVHD